MDPFQSVDVESGLPGRRILIGLQKVKSKHRLDDAIFLVLFVDFVELLDHAFVVDWLVLFKRKLHSFPILQPPQIALSGQLLEQLQEKLLGVLLVRVVKA